MGLTKNKVDITTPPKRVVKPNLIPFESHPQWIDANPVETMQRAKKVETLSKYEVMDTQVKVALQYQRLVRLFPERIKVVDARGKDVPEVYQDAKKIVLEEVTKHYDQ